MRTKTVNGKLEIDFARGVIYFHTSKNGRTLLRICRLPKIPKDVTFIDITHGVGVAFSTAAEEGLKS